MSKLKQLHEQIKKLNWNNLDFPCKNPTDFTNPNQFSRLLANYLKRKIITPDDFKNIFNETAYYWPKEVKKYTISRQDTRKNLGELAWDIYEEHVNQRYWFGWWWDNLSHRHYPSEKWENNGIDSGGAFIFSASKSLFEKPDYFLPIRKLLLEFKLDTVSFKYTYKILDLENYISLLSYMLTLVIEWDRNQQLIPKYYTLASPEEQSGMLKAIHSKRSEMGKKNCVQFYYNLTKSERKELIDQNKLSDTALPMADFTKVYEINKRDLKELQHLK